MASGKGSNTNVTSKRYRFEIETTKGKYAYNYIGESAKQVEQMLWDNIHNATKIEFKGIVHAYKGHDDEGTAE